MTRASFGRNGISYGSERTSCVTDGTSGGHQEFLFRNKLFRRVGFAVGRLAFLWQGVGLLLGSAALLGEFLEDRWSPGRAEASPDHSLPTMIGASPPYFPKFPGGNCVGCWRLRCLPVPHPGQRRHGHQPAWPAGGKWHPPRVGSGGGAGERPVSRCCGSTHRKGLAPGDLCGREERE